MLERCNRTLNLWILNEFHHRMSQWFSRNREKCFELFDESKTYSALCEKICIVNQWYIRIIGSKWFWTIGTLIAYDWINQLNIYEEMKDMLKIFNNSLWEINAMSRRRRIDSILVSRCFRTDRLSTNDIYSRWINIFLIWQRRKQRFIAFFIKKEKFYCQSSPSS